MNIFTTYASLSQLGLCRTLRVLMLFALVPLATGCTTSLIVPKSELIHLDGFDARKEFSVTVATTSMNAEGMAVPTQGIVTQSGFRVISEEGTPITMTSRQELYLLTTDGKRHGGFFRSISADTEHFAGEALKATDGRFDLPMDSIVHGEITALDLTKTYSIIAVLTLLPPIILSGLLLGGAFD